MKIILFIYLFLFGALSSVDFATLLILVSKYTYIYEFVYLSIYLSIYLSHIYVYVCSERIISMLIA